VEEAEEEEVVVKARPSCHHLEHGLGPALAADVVEPVLACSGFGFRV